MANDATRRDFLRTMSGAAATAALGASAQPSEAKRPPNVVLMYFDDLDFDEIGEYNEVAYPSYTGAHTLGLFKDNMNPWLAYWPDGELHTPHIDSLARDGVRFNRFYVTSSLCTPSRYGLLTGRYPSKSPGLQEEYPPNGPANVMQNAFLRPEEDTLAKRMKAAGYATGMVGKWHNTEWDGPHAGRVRGVAPDADPRDPEVAAKVRTAYDRGVSYVRENFGFDYVDRMYLQNKEALGLPKALQVHNMEWLVEGALGFMDRHADEPFFLYFSSPAPHGWIGSGDFLNADPLATPAGMLDERPQGMPPREDTAKRARQAGARGRRLEATWLDDAVGALLGKLDELGVADNTIVLFISDHQNRGKYTAYEGSRGPALMRWPAEVEAGREVDALCANIDVTPTLAEACGAPRNGALDGRSFLPLVAGDGVEASWREALLLEIGYARAVVTDDWKYIALRYPPAIRERAEPGTLSWNGQAQVYEKADNWNEAGDVKTPYGAHKDFPGYFDRDQLYHLATDPYEQHNLAGDPAFAEKLAEMKRHMRRLSKDMPHPFGEFAEGQG